MRNQSKKGPFMTTLLEDRGEMETRISRKKYVIIALTCYTNGRLAKAFPSGASYSTGSSPATSRSGKDGEQTLAQVVSRFHLSSRLS